MTALPIGHRIRTNKEPTFWNKEAAMGFSLGFISPIPFGSVIGGIIGGFIGKSRMHQEQAGGKEVKSPSLLNMDIFPGMVKGILIGTSLALMIGLGLPSLVSAFVMMSKPALVALTAKCFMAANAVMWGGIALGGLSGAIKGKTKMTQEYEQATREYVAQQQSVLPTTQHIREQTVDYGPNHPAHDKAPNHFQSQHQQRQMQPGSPALPAQG